MAKVKTNLVLLLTMAMVLAVSLLPGRAGSESGVSGGPNTAAEEAEYDVAGRQWENTGIAEETYVSPYDDGVVLSRVRGGRRRMQGRGWWQDTQFALGIGGRTTSPPVVPQVMVITDKPPE